MDIGSKYKRKCPKHLPVVLGECADLKAGPAVSLFAVPVRMAEKLLYAHYYRKTINNLRSTIVAEIKKEDLRKNSPQGIALDKLRKVRFMIY